MLHQTIFTISTTGSNQPVAPAVGGMRCSAENTTQHIQRPASAADVIRPNSATDMIRPASAAETNNIADVAMANKVSSTSKAGKIMSKEQTRYYSVWCIGMGHNDGFDDLSACPL